MAGRREVGEGGGWGSALLMPEPVNHHTQEKQHRITAVNHRHMQYCLYSRTDVSLLKAHTYIKLTLFLRQPA